MARYFIFLLTLVCFSFPAMAQEENADEAASKEEIQPIDANETPLEERVELSRKMHEIWPIRIKIENALDAIANNIPEGERVEFKSAMRKAINFDAMEQASIDAMADIYSGPELQAMIDFYGSKEGRSVSHKLLDYEQAMNPIMTQMVDKAILDVRLGQ